MSVTALPSWLAGRAPPGPRPRMRIQRDAKLRVFPFRRFTEEPHRHVTIPPDNVATVASIWRGFAPTTHHLGPHCRATISPSRWMSSSPHLVGLRADGAFPLCSGAPLASLHLDVLLGRLVAGLGGASPRLRLVFWTGWGFAPTPLRRGSFYMCRHHVWAPGRPVGASGGLGWSSRGAHFRPRRGSPGRPRAAPGRPGDLPIQGRPMVVRLHKPTGAICVACR